MRRIGGFWICLAAVSVLVGASGASASSTPAWWSCVKAEPKNAGHYSDKACSSTVESGGKYELQPGVGKGKGFKGTAGTVRFTQLNDTVEFVVECTKNKISGGVLAPNKVVGVVMSLSKCTSKPFGIAKGCSITTKALSGELGWINQAKNEAGLKLTSEAEPEAGVFAEVAGCFEKINLRVRGSLISPFGPVGVITKEPTLSSTTVNFLEGEPPHNARSNLWAFEGEEERHILTAELHGPEPSEWVVPTPGAAALEATFHLKGEALLVK